MTEVIDEIDYEIDGAEFAVLTDHVLTNMHVATDAELNILFIDPEPMEDPHVRWLDLPDPTNVVSSPMDELCLGTTGHPTPADILGDICICPQIAEQQARDAGHTTMEEMLMLAIHGMFHLLGYDHAEENEKKEMFALQHVLLLTLLAT